MLSILLVRLKSLGDILLSSIIAKELSRNLPSVKIDYLVDEQFKDTTRNFIGVSDELVRPCSNIGRILLFKKIFRKYDVAFDLHGSPSASFIARIASKGKVIGFAGRRFDFVYTNKILDLDASRHTVESNLELLRGIGIEPPKEFSIELRRDEEKISRWKKRFGKRPAIIHAGGRFASKIWPSEKFLKVAKALRANGYDVHLLYGPGDKVHEEFKEFPSIEGCRPEDLPNLFGAVSIFIGSDSGPMHFAAAAGCRVVALFGPSNYARWRPYSSRAVIVSSTCKCGFGWQDECKYPSQWCIGKITVDEVLSAVKKVEEM